MTEKPWKVLFTSQALKQLKKLDKQIQSQITEHLKLKVLKSKDLTSLGKPLSGPKKGIWRYRVGPYRILCHIHAKEITILVLTIGHRKHIYQH